MDSYNPNSNKEAEFNKAIDKLITEHLNLQCERALNYPYDHIEYGELNEDIGIIMSKQEYKSRCANGEFNDDNGYGFYVHNDNTYNETTSIEAKPTWALNNKLRKDFSQIVWYFSKDIDVDNQLSETSSFEDIIEEF